jgi:hypothetical protein
MCGRFVLMTPVLACNFLHLPQQFFVMGEEVKRSMEWLIKRLSKVGAKRSEVAGPCGLGFPLGPVLPSSIPVRAKKF